MHDAIFAKTNWREVTRDTYLQYAAELGLDLGRFERDIASEAIKRRVEADTSEAARIGIRGTPGFLINGKFLSGAQPFESFKRLIDQEVGS